METLVPSAMPEPSANPENPGGALSLEVLDATGRLTHAEVAWLTESAVNAARLTGSCGNVAVRVIDDVEMARSHEEFADVSGTTDVLTFDLGSQGSVVEADVLVCIDEAARQSAARGHPVKQELLLYILHGVLHCLGYDDHDDEAYARMHAEEDRVMVALGLGKTFDKRAGGAA